MPKAMTHPARRTVEHPFGTHKAWPGGTHFPIKTPEKVKTEMRLRVRAYHFLLKNLIGAGKRRTLSARRCLFQLGKLTRQPSYLRLKPLQG